MIFSKLSNELNIYIYKFLDLEDLYFLSMVCKYHNYLINKNLRYICLSSFNNLSSFYQKNSYFKKYDFTIIKILNSYIIDKLNKIYNINIGYDTYYEKEISRRGFQFYYFFRILKNENLIDNGSYRKILILSIDEFIKFFIAKKFGFYDLSAFNMAQKLNIDQINQAKKLKEDTILLEYQIIDKVMKIDL